MATTKIRSSAQLNIDNSLDFQTQKGINLVDPTSAQDAATKAYVDAAAAGITWKAAVRLATTANITLSGNQTIDGVGTSTGDRVLVKDQTLGQNNGIYTAAAGAWVRAADANNSGPQSSEVNSGMAVLATQGTLNAGTGWVLTTQDPIILGTTVLVFVQFTGLGDVIAGAGLTKSGNTIDVVAGDASLTVAADSIVVAAGDTSITVGGAIRFNTAILIKRETPTGAINGVNVTFTLANTPIAGSEEVFLNGILQEPGAGNDYTISGLTITYLTAPATGDRLRVSYTKTP